MNTEKQNKPYITLTPAGVFEAFSHHELTSEKQALQALLNGKNSVLVEDWISVYGAEALEVFSNKGWIEYLKKPLTAPNLPLDEFLPYVIASLSGSRRAAIGSNEGFCLARIGFSNEEAEKLCVAGADFFDFITRQQQRGLVIKEQAISFFNEVDLLMPSTSFVFFCVDEVGYVLIIEKEPLTHNQALVSLIWAIKNSGLKFH